VLNTDGKVVGVHGKGDRERNSSTGEPSGAKTGFNTAIPIARFADISQSLGITLGTRVAQTIPSSTLTADDYFLSANQKYEINDLRGSLADYNQAISLNPKYSAAYYNRGNLKDDLNDPQSALADFNIAISLDPKYSAAYNNRGFIKHRKLNDPQGALTDYNLAISLNPKYTLAYNNRGSLKREKLNDPQGALTDYSKAISLNPKFADAYYNRGLLKKNKLNDRAGAVADFRTAAKLYRQQGKTSDLQDAIDRLRALGASE
jgi:tetratricopeptide (TPR) repeat protein